MAQLRDILLETQKEKTLYALFQGQAENLTQEEKDHYLGILGDQIERDVDKLLHDYVITFNESTPVKKKGKRLRYFYTAFNIISNVGIAYAVNIEAWVFVTILSILLVGNQFLPFVYEE